MYRADKIAASMDARVGSGRGNIRELSRPASLSRATADVIARLQHPNILGLMTQLRRHHAGSVSKSSEQAFVGTLFVLHTTCVTTVIC